MKKKNQIIIDVPEGYEVGSNTDTDGVRIKFVKKGERTEHPISEEKRPKVYAYYDMWIPGSNDRPRKACGVVLHAENGKFIFIGNDESEKMELFVAREWAYNHRICCCRHCHLPDHIEWQYIFDNLEEINSRLLQIGGDPIFAARRYWLLPEGIGNVEREYGCVGKLADRVISVVPQNEYCYARAICTIEINR